MSKTGKLLGLVLATIVSLGTTITRSEEKVPPLPAVKEMIYSRGEDDEGWLDMGYPYTDLGKFEVGSADAYPAAIYGQAANIYAHTIDLRFQLKKPRDLVLVIDFLLEVGGKESAEELKVLVNGQFVQFIDLKPEPKKKEKMQQEKEEKRYEVIELAAEEGENVITLDMSHNHNWFNCWFDSIQLYEPEVGEETPEVGEEAEESSKAGS